MKKLILIIILASIQSQACQFDSDCSLGSRCEKGFGEINGICTGGMNPGNQYDQKPVYNVFAPQDKTGDSCQFDLECGMGLSCVKRADSLRGVCR